MPSSPTPRVPKPGDTYSDGTTMGAVKTPTESRQGVRGRPVLVILGVSLVLAITALGLVYYYFSVPTGS